MSCSTVSSYDIATDRVGSFTSGNSQFLGCFPFMAGEAETCCFCKSVKRHWLLIACKPKVHRISRSQNCGSVVFCLSDPWVFASCIGSMLHPYCAQTALPRVHKSCRGLSIAAVSRQNLLSKLHCKLCCLEKGTCRSEWLSATSPSGLTSHASVGCVHVGAGGCCMHGRERR